MSVSRSTALAMTTALALSAQIPIALSAQSPTTMPGYSPTAAATQRRLEQDAIRAPQATRARTHSAALSKEPHVAGTPAQKRTADYVIEQMNAMGLETELRTYDVYLPHATGVKLTRLGRDTVVLDLQEPGIAGDPATMLPQYLPVNGYGGAGVGEGELVFVNFGLIEDYATAARIGAAMLLRLANAQLLPYDYAEFARTMTRYVAPVERGLTQKGWNAAAVAPLVTAIARLEKSATAFAVARDAALAAAIAPAAQLAANSALLRVERALARPSGLKSRPWYRSLIYASDVDNGYSTMSFPGINESIRYGTQAETVAEINDLAARFGAAADAVDAARGSLSANATR